MRIISGDRRGLRLFSPQGLATRPTLDQVKEAAFNIWQFDVPGGVFLDLFAGSGQIGIEALSRGADSVYFFEPDRGAFQTLQKNLTHIKADGRAKPYPAPYARLASVFPKPRFDLVYIDPPYQSGAYEEALKFLVEGGYLHDGSTVICEAEAKEPLPERVGFLSDSPRRYGRVALHVYRKKEDEG